MLIPSIRTIENIRLKNLLNGKEKLTIIVVEKESTFQYLMQTLFQEKVTNQINYNPNNWCLITGKGYPDFNTLEFLMKLNETFKEKIEIIGLFDQDPFGYDIYLNYKYGSTSSAYHSLRIFNMKLFRMNRNEIHDNQLLSMTLIDRKKSLDLLKKINNYLNSCNDENDQEIKQDLQLLKSFISKDLHNNYKFELQAQFH